MAVADRPGGRTVRKLVAAHGGARVILGINCFSHDTAACLVVDGQVVALCEEERFNRQTHTKRFPHQAIASCLRRGGLSMAEVDVVAVAHRPGADAARGALDALGRGAARRLAAQAFVDGRLVARDQLLRQVWGYRGPIVHVDHHQAHAAAAFYASPFDEAAVLTLDRGGDFLSTTWGYGQGHQLQRWGRIKNPNSLGEVYTAVTAHLGFYPGMDEGKVMGLAPYGTPALVEAFDQFVHLEPDGGFQVDYRWFGYQREANPVSARFVDAFGPAREPESEITPHHKDLAYAVQDLIERCALHVARALRRQSPTGNLALAGGLALNSVMNGRLLAEAGFDQLFVQPAAGDNGNALGAALWVWHDALGHPRAWRMTDAYLGDDWGEREYREALDRAGVAYRSCDDPAGEAARLLADSKVVGRFTGREEAGPRALGNRSILADPRRTEMRDIVNERVKRREWFRPFAPAVLHERGAELFDQYSYSPFMLLVVPVVKEHRDAVPAITHVDGTARVQSVTTDTNLDFYRLVERFGQLTGVPVVLNTSFNLRGEPIVHRPAEAVADFLRSDMDALFLGPYLATKVPLP